MENPQRTAELIRRYLDGECTDQESAELSQQLRENPQAAESFADAARMDALLTTLLRTERQSSEVLSRLALERPDGEDAVVAEVPKPTMRRWRRFHWLAIAVVAVSLLVAILYLPWQNDPGGQSCEVLSGNVLVEGVGKMRIREGSTIRVAGKTRAAIRLSDGSHIELEPATRAILHGQSQGRRQVVELLQGGGTFRVEKVPGDFQVATNLGTVTVLGTRFSVWIAPPGNSKGANANPQSAALAVAVLVGSVQVEVAGKTYVLGSGENRVFAENLKLP